MEDKKIRIAILGCGTVGGGTYDILQKNKNLIEKRTGKEYEVAAILDRSGKNCENHNVPEGIRTDNIEDILDDETIDIVVDSIGGMEPSISWMKAILRSGKNLVTPNKAAVAANYAELVALAEENHVQFRYEAAVCGGIPVLSSVLESLSGNNFSRVSGILNGTTNYILSKMTREGISYEEALKAAQENGFAEADPTADVEGMDAANKLCILMAMCFDRYILPDTIPCRGITDITVEDINKAKENNCTIKLIANAYLNNAGELHYNIGPEEVPNDNPLSGISDEYNAITIEGDAVGNVMFTGKGAGALPTGSAVVGDIIAILKALN